MPAGSGPFAWAYDLRLRAKDTAGAVVSTYKPSPSTYRTPDPPVPENDEEEITLADGSDGTVTKGMRLVVLWVPLSIGGSFPGADGFDSLEAVLNDSRRKAGGVPYTLELSLDGGTTYRTVRLRSDSGPRRWGRVNSALEREMEFVTRSYVAAETAPDGSGW